MQTIFQKKLFKFPFFCYNQINHHELVFIVLTYGNALRRGGS